MRDAYWNHESQQWEVPGGGGYVSGPTPAPVYTALPPDYAPVAPTGSPFGRNQYGQDYGGRTTGYNAAAALEGRDQSNLLDPTPFLQSQVGRFNPETGQYEGGYEGAYLGLFDREDPIAIGLGDEFIRRGQRVADRSSGYSDLIAGEAGRVSGYAPRAIQEGMLTADRMRSDADVVRGYGPEAVAAARGDAGYLRGQADDLRGFTDPAATALTDYGGNQLALYGSQFRPIEQQIAEFAREYDAPGRRQREAERSRATVARQFEEQRRSAARDLARYGIDPSMGRGQAIRDRTAQATAQAAADEAARRRIEDQGIALRAAAAQLGGNIAGRGTTATGAGAQVGAQGAQGAAGIRQGAAGVEQQGVRTGADLAATGANIESGAGSAALQGLQTGGNLSQASGQLLTGAANVDQSGATTGTNIQSAGQGARQGAVPLLNSAQNANLQGANIMQNWNAGIWGTQGNRMSQPSGLAGAAGTALGLIGGTVANRFIPSPTPTSPTTGGTGRADGGYLYSTRQRFADGGVMPSGIPAYGRNMNGPAVPALRDGGEIVMDPRCQRFGKSFRMPDGTPCKLEDAVNLADGGGVWPILGTLAGGLIGAAFGGPAGAVTGAKLGGTAGSAISGGGGSATSSPGASTRALPAPTSLGAAPTSSLPDGPIPVTAVAAAHGGRVHGPSDGTGIDDQIPANLSAGEYVIPADVVAKLGTLHFDKLLDKHHTPADQQRAQS